MTRRSLRSFLADAGYAPDALRRLLGARSVDDIGLLNHAASVERVAGDRSAAAVLVRLFFLEESEPVAGVRRALGGSTAALFDAAWLRQRKRAGRTEVCARMRIDPIGERYFVADLRFRAMDRSAVRLPRGDEVYPPSSDSMLLEEVIQAERPDGARPVPVPCSGAVASANCGRRRRSISVRARLPWRGSTPSSTRPRTSTSGKATCTACAANASI
jgi:hypothetical protein